MASLCFFAPKFLNASEMFGTGKSLVGGGEVYLLDLGKFFLAKGFDVKVVQGGSEAREFDYQGIEIKQIPAQTVFSFSLKWPQAAPKADFINFHDWSVCFPFVSSDATCTFHGGVWDVPYYGRNENEGFLKWSFKRNRAMFLADYAIKKCRACVSVDTFLIRYVQSKMPDLRDKFSFIPNYVDLNLFKPRNARKKGKTIILYPRGLAIGRGTRLITQAVGLIKDQNIELWMAGTGEDREYCEQAAAKDERIKLLGHKDHYKEMPQLYNEADIVVIPSLGSEGTSLSCLEAMASGKPVVAGDIGGLIDLIEYGESGFLSNTLPEVFAKHLSMLINDSSLRKKIGLNARKRAERFSKKTWETRWLEFVENNLRK